jgi:hypothetical protein
MNYLEHIKEEHNIWNYMYFFIYLRNKKHLDSIDTYIMSQIAAGNYSFLNLSNF